MSLNLDDKKAVVAEVSAQVVNAQTIVVAQYAGIEVGNLTALRAKARDAGVYLRVLKNTLARRAVADTPIPSREELLSTLLGVMQAPVSSFAGAMAALAKKREEEAAAA